MTYPLTGHRLALISASIEEYGFYKTSRAIQHAYNEGIISKGGAEKAFSLIRAKWDDTHIVSSYSSWMYLS